MRSDAIPRELARPILATEADGCRFPEAEVHTRLVYGACRHLPASPPSPSSLVSSPGIRPRFFSREPGRSSRCAWRPMGSAGVRTCHGDDDVVCYAVLNWLWGKNSGDGFWVGEAVFPFRWGIALGGHVVVSSRRHVVTSSRCHVVTCRGPRPTAFFWPALA